MTYIYFLFTLEIEWKWVKAHDGNRWNEYVDNLARKCAETV